MNVTICKKKQTLYVLWLSVVEKCTVISGAINNHIRN